MDGSSWVQLFGVGGVATVIVAIIGAVASNRVQKANAGNIAIQSADTQIANLEGERDYWEKQTIKERERANTLDGKIRGWFQRADAMMVWIRRQERRLEEAGVVDPAPALYPPDGE
jgi:hypothetical protein